MVSDEGGENCLVTSGLFTTLTHIPFKNNKKPVVNFLDSNAILFTLPEPAPTASNGLTKSNRNTITS